MRIPFSFNCLLVKNMSWLLKYFLSHNKSYGEKYKAEKVILFGFVLDEDRFYLRSDVDLAVFGLKDELFYKAYAEVMNILSGFEVDLLDYKECRDSFKEEIKEQGGEL